MYYMGTTLTVRTDDEMDRGLRDLARAEGLSLSQLVRRILEDAIHERTLQERAGHLAGSLGELDAAGDAWREQIRRRNWRE